jgi:hypothetical protein
MIEEIKIFCAFWIEVGEDVDGEIFDIPLFAEMVKKDRFRCYVKHS